MVKGKGRGRRFQGAWNDKPTRVGYQGICGSCGKVGHQQRECTKSVKVVDCDNAEADFCSRRRRYQSQIKRGLERVRREAKFCLCGHPCKERCCDRGVETGNTFAELSEEEKEDDEDEQESKEVEVKGEGQGNKV